MPNHSMEFSKTADLLGRSKFHPLYPSFNSVACKIFICLVHISLALKAKVFIILKFMSPVSLRSNLNFAITA